jgi:hypothetical protein
VSLAAVIPAVHRRSDAIYVDLEFTRQEALMRRLSPLRPLIDDVVATGTPLESHVLRWCLENYIPLPTWTRRTLTSSSTSI